MDSGRDVDDGRFPSKGETPFRVVSMVKEDAP